jgi:hypothetical protein
MGISLNEDRANKLNRKSNRLHRISRLRFTKPRFALRHAVAGLVDRDQVRPSRHEFAPGHGDGCQREVRHRCAKQFNITLARRNRIRVSSSISMTSAMAGSTQSKSNAVDKGYRGHATTNPHRVFVMRHSRPARAIGRGGRRAVSPAGGVGVSRLAAEGLGWIPAAPSKLPPPEA